MLKRPNEGMGREEFASTSDTGNDVVQKKRKIQFEAVRMPAFQNVTDMKDRTVVYQAAKLKQQILYKNKRIAELEKDYERARRRQSTDEQQFFKLYNFFSEVTQYICQQTRNEFGEHPSFECSPSGIALQGLSSDQYSKLADEWKNNLRSAFQCFAKARQERTQEQNRFVHKVKSVLDDPHNRIDSVHRELADRAAQLASQNERLQKEVTAAQNELHLSERKRRTLQDKHDSVMNRVDELEKMLEDAKFETDKQMRLASKFEHRLAIEEKARQESAAGASATSDDQMAHSDARNTAPATPPSEQTQKEIENLRAERDEKAELSARRLQELNESHKKIQAMATEISKLKTESQAQPSVPNESVHNNEEFKTLKKYYSLAVREYERVSKEIEEVTYERDKLRNISEQRYYAMCDEQAKTLKEIQATSEAHTNFYKIMHDNEVLRAEFEIVAQEHSKTVKQGEWDELKNTMNSMRALNSTLKSDLVRKREKNKSAKEEIQKLKAEIKKLRDVQERSLLVPLDELRETPAVQPEEYNRMRQEYEGLRREIRRLAAQDKQDKIDHIQKELERQLGQKYTELETLRRTNEVLESDEQCISDELETIGSALEELQEKSTQLVRDKQEQEDRNLKMMNDRMIQNQVQSRMKEKIDALERKADIDSQMNKMSEFRLKGIEEQNIKFAEVLQFKSAELARVTSSLEAHRKNLAEIALARDEYMMKVEKSEHQVNNLKEMYTAKTKEVEELKFKRSRIEEDLDMLKTKYDKVKKMEAAGGPGGDQVLEEANRQMKETLTCPSCKTRPKDCIMLKCYHLFCETCIKTMYDTRQRKCPKCNSNFGANDFHRVFI